MIIVDTSIWIRFLAGREPFASRLDLHLRQNEVVGHELVYGELLVGDRGGRTRLLADYASMHQASTVPHHEVVTFVRHRRLNGLGLGWIDVHLLASAVVGNLRLWSADARLEAAAQELGVGVR
ncbi:MAG: PIN domain-containing protein [Myxococcota bacterium]